MPNLPITRYRIHYQANTAIRLPAYAGSVLRGAFGHALKNIACLSASRNKGVCCCQPISSCTYRQLFDPEKVTLANQREQDIAPPVIVEPVFADKVILLAEQAYFDMVLIGRFAYAQLAIVQLAWQRALQEGIGTKNEYGRRGSAQLLRIEVLNQPVLSAELAPKTQYVHLQLISPLRLQQRGDLVIAPHLTPAILLWAMIRRYQLIHELYGQVCEIDYVLLGSAIEQVGLQKRLKWTEWTRFSSRQKKQMKLSGLTGHILLENIPPLLMPYVYIGQWLHMGKNSVFGLGHYQVIDDAWITSKENID